MKKTSFYKIILLGFTLLYNLACSTSGNVGHGGHGGAAASTPTIPTETLVKNVRQITFEGTRAGEGYFSNDGKLMIFQSEREGNNPFYQMYLKDLETGKTIRVSTGKGKTTCGWIHPDKKRVLYSSTHLDPKVPQKSREEFSLRKSGAKRSYSWDFDENYEIFEVDVKKYTFKNLTNTKGYDAESSWSPDGKWIAFASDRHAFNAGLSDDEKVAASKNPSALVELYIMKADGSDVKRLTADIGYDGGPFFSPDGKKITWRKFNPSGDIAEVYTMNVDGSDKKQITHLNSMSWAPYFHPSGEYIIFGTSVFGHHNFELFLVRSDGKGEPQRVTSFEKFDSLPVFLPNGVEMAWTSHRSWDGKAQIFISDWDDQAARKLLGLSHSKSAELKIAQPTQELKKHIEYLSSPDLGGRLAGSSGERLAAEYVANQFRQIGLKPEGDNDSYFQDFEFYSGVELGEKNYLAQSRDSVLKLEQDWRPLSFSSSGHYMLKDAIFVGYGIVAPSGPQMKAFDSYEGIDVKDKWVVSFRFLPEKADEKYRIHLGRFSDLPFKARKAKEKGAKGIIFVSGPSSAVKNQLVPLGKNSTDLGIFAVSISDEVFKGWLKATEPSLDLAKLQSDLDELKTAPNLTLKLGMNGMVDLIKKKEKGRNVIGRFVVGKNPSGSAILIGGHLDHLGLGETNTSRANEKQQGMYHPGADDNASGVASIIEIAREVMGRLKEGRLKDAQKDIVFAAWSGEELGLLGSNHFVSQAKGHSLQPKIESYINLDMVGRYIGQLYAQGVGSSPYWLEIVERMAPVSKLPLFLQEDPYLPTDAMTLYTKHVPVISFFTGSHTDYHSPTDSADKINYDGVYDITRFISDLSMQMMREKKLPEYKVFSGKSQMMARSDFRVSLGTLPDYVQSPDTKGVKLSGVKPGSPAEKAGLQKDDVIVELAGKKISNIYEYSDLLRLLKPGEEIKVRVIRSGKDLSLKVLPDSRN
ncbi:MAG: M28 family peptidase [Pseudomonadota bacterium]|nr:M28 family peptidase [Pseudomonadota bacterium]